MYLDKRLFNLYLACFCWYNMQRVSKCFRLPTWLWIVFSFQSHCSHVHALSRNFLIAKRIKWIRIIFIWQLIGWFVTIFCKCSVNSRSEKFCKTYRETPAMEFFYQESCKPVTYNSTRRGIRWGRFSVNFTEHFQATAFVMKLG